MFFIDTDTGQIATQRQLVERGIMSAVDDPPRPWFRIRASGDATTLWHAVMRKRERGIFIGTLVFRHSTHHSLLREQGWEDVPIAEIGPSSPQPFGD